MKDILLKWKKDFPYDAAREVGISPSSSMADIKKASLNVLGKGLPSKIREALDELRLIKSRLFVDFFLYHINGKVVSEDLLEKDIKTSMEEIDIPDVSSYLRPDTSDLVNMDKEFNLFQFNKIDIEYLNLHEEVESELKEFIIFDS